MGPEEFDDGVDEGQDPTDSGVADTSTVLTAQQESVSYAENMTRSSVEHHVENVTASPDVGSAPRDTSDTPDEPGSSG